MLGRLEKVDLREVWKHEALNFTNWLAREENINLLSDTIGIDIEIVGTEKSIGSFNVDMVARDRSTDSKIIIENQLERTDHDHLGKIITYASGYDADTIIWLVKDVRDEHRKAVEWLNSHLDERINIFLIRIEVWKIGDSMPAPKFSIVESPNNWAKILKSTSSTGITELSNTKKLQIDFWTKFKEQEERVNYSIRSPRPQAWLDIGLGTGKYFMRVEVYKKKLRVSILVQNDKDVYISLYEKRVEIENCFDESLEWEEKDGRTVGKISCSKDFILDETEEWDKNIEWIVNQSNKFVKCFKN